MLPVVSHTCTPGEFCPMCAHNKRLGAKGGNQTKPTPTRSSPARVPLPVHKEPCRFRGEQIGVTDLYQCDKFDDVTCPGRRCKRADRTCLDCTSYEAPPDGKLPRWHPTTDPVPQRTHPRLLVSLVIGEEAEALHAVTGPSHRRYAERVNAQYHVIRGKTQDSRMVCAEKWRVGPLVPHWERTLYLDADVWVDPLAPDVFDATPVGSVGVVDLVPRTPHLLPWVKQQVTLLLQSQRLPVPPVLAPKYWNSGVWVGDPTVANYWTPPAHPYPADWCTEEIWCRLNAELGGLKIHDLNPRFNWTWIEDRGLERVGAHRPWFWHFAGLGDAQADKVPEWKMTNRAWRLAMLRLLETVGEKNG